MPTDPASASARSSPDKLRSLIEVWEAGRSGDREPTPEELCPHDSELRERLREHISAAKARDPLASTFDPNRTSEHTGTTVANATPAPPGYRVIRELGRGGMGVVYEAVQTRLNRPVALKLVLGGGATGPGGTRFLAEAEAVAAARHPNVVQVYESGEHDGQPFLAMEFLPGGTLAERIKAAGRLPAADAAGLVEKLTRGVQAAHDRQIVHRDLKPGNVLFDERGEPKVTDFGLAKHPDREDLTRTGAVLGSPAYMSPEQADGKAKFVGPAADVYALGVILYECLTGTRPFTANNTAALLRKVAEEEPERPRRREPSVPRDLELVCLKCLAKDPTVRYTTAAALADDLANVLAARPVTARPPGTLYTLGKFVRRNKVVAGFVAALFVTMAAGTGFSMYYADAEAKEAARANGEAIRATEKADEARLRLASKAFTDGDYFRRQGKYAAALESYRIAEQNGYPDQVGLTLGLYDAHNMLGHSSELVPLMESLMSRDDLGDRAAEARFQAALLGYNVGRPIGGDPDELMKAALGGNLPPDLRAYAQAALAPTLLEMAAQLEESVRLNPANPDTLSFLFICHILQGKYHDAGQVLSKLEVIVPDSLATVGAEALLSFMEGDAKRLEAGCVRLSRFSPRLAELFRKAAPAVRPLFSGEILDSGNPSVVLAAIPHLWGLIQEFVAGVNLGVADPEPIRVTKIFKFPVFRRIMSRLDTVSFGSIAAVLSGQSNELTAEMRRVFPATGFTYLNDGLELFNQKKFRESVPLFRRAFETPSYINVKRQAVRHEVLALTMAGHRGDLVIRPEAAEEWRDALRRLATYGPLPDDPISDLIFMAAVRNGEAAIGELLLSEVFAKDPSSDRTLRLRQWLARHRGQYDQALTLIEILVRRHPEDETYRKYQASLRRELKEQAAQTPRLLEDLPVAPMPRVK